MTITTAMNPLNPEEGNVTLHDFEIVQHFVMWQGIFAQAASSINAVLVGGNHLANALLSTEDPAKYRHAEYNQVLEAHGQPYADMWAAWKAIMDLRDSVNA